MGAQAALAQVSTPCVNDAPDPYRRGASFALLPDGRNWGSTAGVAVAPDGTIWGYDRCGANSCAGSPLDPIIAFSPDGKGAASFRRHKDDSVFGAAVGPKEIKKYPKK